MARGGWVGFGDNIKISVKDSAVKRLVRVDGQIKTQPLSEAAGPSLLQATRQGSSLAILGQCGHLPWLEHWRMHTELQGSFWSLSHLVLFR